MTPDPYKKPRKAADSAATVIGIDVGGPAKGFHAVAMNGRQLTKFEHTDPAKIAAWCQEQGARVVAVDAPSGWSETGKSRQAERDLKLKGVKIHCFSTPTRAVAKRKAFYNWVFNGERLYKKLADHYCLFDGQHTHGPICIETFPNAIVCAWHGRVVSATPKVPKRRAILKKEGFDDSVLPNIDYVDAALCALAARAFLHRNTISFGKDPEGWIVIPKPRDP